MAGLPRNAGLRVLRGLAGPLRFPCFGGDDRSGRHSTFTPMAAA
jgi:hypothetical protein